jgi:hypothetical protein
MTLSLKWFLAMGSVLLLVSACKSAASAEAVAAATLYFPPNFKYVEEPRYSFSSAERQRALQEYREQGADTLFELVIDHQGRVMKARLLRTHVSEVYHDDMIHHALRMEFSPDANCQMYRAFYFPAKYSHTAEFEWQ